MKPEETGRVRDNISAKMGAQTQRREFSDKRTPPSWGADGVLNLATVTGGPGV